MFDPLPLEEPEAPSLHWEGGVLVMLEGGRRAVLISEPQGSIFDEPAHPGAGHWKRQTEPLNRFDALLAAAGLGLSVRPDPPSVRRAEPAPAKPKPPADRAELLTQWDFPLWKRWGMTEQQAGQMIAKTLGAGHDKLVARLKVLYREFSN